MELYEIQIKKGMKKDEVNKCIGKWLKLEDDEYLGNLHMHNWKCSISGCIFEKKWNNIRYGLSFRCPKCREYYYDKDINYCTVCGKKDDNIKKGLCRRHQWQLEKHGEFLDTENKMHTLELNEYITYDSYIEVILKDRYEKREVNRIKIDLDDIWILSEYRLNWHQRYADLTVDGKSRRFHRWLMNVTDDTLVVDHINGDRTDNRKCNLRICSQLENVWNTRGKEDRGVRILPSGRFQAYITFKGKRVTLGTFDNKEDAIKVRRKAEEDKYGEYAVNKEGVGV